MLPEIVIQKLADLPVSPGVYLFKDKKGDVIYVGKAKSLRARVRSYFQAGSSDTRFFIPTLERYVGDLETIVTQSEKEAQILENSLIKRHHPRFNVKLRDDKEYLSIKLSLQDEWPRLYLVRKPKGKKSERARHFGPYHSATAARRTLHVVNKHFQLRTCTDTDLKNRKRPCLQYQIKRCPAPCVYEVERSFYDEQVHAVSLFLDGKHDELSRELEEKMQRAARALQFELAAVYRDQLGAIESTREAQRVVTEDRADRDVFGVYREAELVEVAILHVRSGRLRDVSAISLKQIEIPDSELIAGVLVQHYVGEREEDEGDADTNEANVENATIANLPREILLPVLPEASAGIEEFLGEAAGHKVSLLEPQRGLRARLLDMAKAQAKHGFAEKRRASDDVVARLTQIKDKLRLPSLPHRIECCDISHLGGGDTVGAIVLLTDGTPDKKGYRSFNVKTVGATSTTGGALGDDYGAMYEVLARRFRRSLMSAKEEAEKAKAGGEGDVKGGGGGGGDAAARDSKSADAGDEKPREWELPDLFVVDGGRGQLAVALAAAHDLGLHDLPIVALAKEKENVLGETLVDRVYLPGQKNPIPLRSHSSSLFYLARARDEAHRFANYARERRGKKKRFHSALDDVRGLGEAVKKELQRTLGSIPAIANASDAELLAVPGVTARHVKAIRAGLHATPSHAADATNSAIVSTNEESEGDASDLSDARVDDADDAANAGEPNAN